MDVEILSAIYLLRNTEFTWDLADGPIRLDHNWSANIQ